MLSFSLSLFNVFASLSFSPFLSLSLSESLSLFLSFALSLSQEPFLCSQARLLRSVSVCVCVSVCVLVCLASRIVKCGDTTLSPLFPDGSERHI